MINIIGQAIMDSFIESDPSIIERYRLIYGKSNNTPFEEIDSIVDSLAVSLFPGGCSLNVAIGLENQDTDFCFFSTTGADTQGSIFEEKLMSLRHASIYNQSISGRTGIVLTFYSKTNINERTNLFNHGVSNTLTHLTIGAGSYVYINLLSMYGGGGKDILGALLNKGSSLSFLDIQGIDLVDRETLSSIMPHMDFIFANKPESLSLQKLCNMSLEEISRRTAVIVKNSVGPVQFYESGRLRLSIEPREIVSCKHNIGAGDYFAAGFLSSYSSGENVKGSIINGIDSAITYLRSRK